MCCSRKRNAKHKAFLSEKRRLVYEQLEYATSTSPGGNNPNNRLNGKVSVDSR